MKIETSINNFSIVQASGHQYLFESGKWYDLNKILGNEEDVVRLQRILLHKKIKNLVIGKPCIDNTYVLGNIVQHFRGKKICIFKYKPKKKYTRKIGFRAALSRIRIKRIFEKNI